MRVAELIEHRTFRVREDTIAAPAPGEIQVRVEAVGICGSDLHSYAEGAVGDTACNYPMVLGHEPAGVIVKIGGGVSGKKNGQHTAVCGACHLFFECTDTIS